MRFLVLFVLIFSFSDAHKVNLFINQENEVLDIYSYFANGAPCKNCELVIKQDEKIILEDKLDDKGTYLYTPKIKTLEVIVNASGGHIAKQIVTVENIKKENLEEHLKKQNSDEDIKILIGLGLIFLIFLVLKMVKRK